MSGTRADVPKSMAASYVPSKSFPPGLVHVRQAILLCFGYMHQRVSQVLAVGSVDSITYTLASASGVGRRSYPREIVGETLVEMSRERPSPTLRRFRAPTHGILYALTPRGARISEALSENVERRLSRQTLSAAGVVVAARRTTELSRRLFRGDDGSGGGGGDMSTRTKRERRARYD